MVTKYLPMQCMLTTDVYYPTHPLPLPPSSIFQLWMNNSPYSARQTKSATIYGGISLVRNKAMLFICRGKKTQKKNTNSKYKTTRRFEKWKPKHKWIASLSYRSKIYLSSREEVFQETLWHSKELKLMKIKPLQTSASTHLLLTIKNKQTNKKHVI